MNSPSDKKGRHPGDHTEEKRRFVVPDDLQGRPLDGVLKRWLDVSWNDARKLLRSGKIRLAGQPTADGERAVRAGDTIEIDPRGRPAERGTKLDRAALVYVDPSVVVVDKPAGISTVPYEERERDTLDQLVAGLLRKRSATGPTSSLGVVQRLDKETSGLLVFARTFAAKKVLGNQLRQRTVHRRYLALAHGRVSGASLRSYLTKDRGDGLRGTTRLTREGQLAVTHVEPVEVLEGATLVACRLETGRTHQIRIQLAEAGHPLLGERVYVRNFEGERLPAPRVMLHAAELGFIHPVHGAEMKFESPPPADFEAVLARLRSR
ncbi:MAG TPA: RluA family pseudouridine synthase [Polyangiaceae bacterium]